MRPPYVRPPRVMTEAARETDISEQRRLSTCGRDVVNVNGEIVELASAMVLDRRDQLHAEMRTIIMRRQSNQSLPGDRVRFDEIDRELLSIERARS